MIELPEKGWIYGVMGSMDYIDVGEYKVHKSCFDSSELKLNWIIECIERIVEEINVKG